MINSSFLVDGGAECWIESNVARSLGIGLGGGMFIYSDSTVTASGKGTLLRLERNRVIALAEKGRCGKSV